MKILNITLIIALALTSFSAKAQTEKVSPKEQTVSSTEKSEYFSVEIEKKIKSHLISNEIPASLPKHIAGKSEADYKKVVKVWMRKNIELVKEESRDKVLGKNKRAPSREVK